MRFTRNWILATFILTFLVIIAGGIVRTTQSGMGCPDWPRCFGKWIPPTDASELPADFEKYLGKQDIDHSFNVMHTWIEYFNRLLGTLLGVFAIIQVVLLFRQRAQLRRSYKLSLFFLLTVILTGLFGAVVVKLNLAHVSISVHLLFAVLLIQVQLALMLSARSKFAALPVDHKIKKLLSAFLVLLLVQCVLGTIVRIHVDDISKALDYQQRDEWLSDNPVVFVIHRSFSWIVVLFVSFLGWFCNKTEAIRGKVFLLAGIIFLSMGTGITLFYANMPATAQPVHLLLATLAITQTFSILFQVRQHKPA